jgi:hypothetical protein
VVDLAVVELAVGVGVLGAPITSVLSASAVVAAAGVVRTLSTREWDRLDSETKAAAVPVS